MNVNSLTTGSTFNENPLETGIRPLAEVTASGRYDFRRTVAAPVAMPPVAAMNRLSPSSITAIAAANGYSMEQVQEIGTKLHGNEDFDAACQELTGKTVAELTTQLMGTAESVMHDSGSAVAAVDAQFDAGKNGPAVAFMGLGPTELVVIGVIAILLFGKRLPEVLRGLGKGLRGFKEEVAGVQQSIENAGKPTGNGDGEGDAKPAEGDSTEVDEEEDEGGKKKL